MPEPEFVTTKDRSFVTVSEAARALQLSERQVRRYAGRMAESDRLTSGSSPARVRLSALAVLAGKVIVEESTPEEVTGSSPAPAGHSDRPPGESVRPVSEDLATLREQLASVTAERDGLTARLADTASDRDAWKDQAGRLDTRLAEALEALQRSQDAERSARLIGQRPAPMLSPVGTPDDSQSSPDVPGGVIPSHGQTKRPWWSFWNRRA